ncbi:MAG: glycosyltransferase family 2 protein [Candidatus Woesearchaeota archaeon]
MNNKSVYGVLLNWNGKEHLEYCIPSLLKTKYNGFKILLVDNGSTDGSVDFVKRNFRTNRIKILKLDKNYGYSKGMNIGIKYALQKKADFICTINNDIIVDPRWITESLKVFSKYKDIGVIGFDMLGMEERGDIQRFKKEQKLRKVFHFEYKSYVLDALMIVKSEVFKRVGFFDEKYITYGEEEDLFARISLAGYKLVELSVPVYHYGHGTADKIPLKTSYLMMRNSIRYSLKWLPIIDTLKRIGYIGHISCNPFARFDKKNIVATKLRPSNIFVNSILFIKAVMWNIVFLPQTIMIRRQQRKEAIGSIVHKAYK